MGFSIATIVGILITVIALKDMQQCSLQCWDSDMPPCMSFCQVLISLFTTFWFLPSMKRFMRRHFTVRSLFYFAVSRSPSVELFCLSRFACWMALPSYLTYCCSPAGILPCFVLRLIPLWHSFLHFVQINQPLGDHFDSTLGFPGEGPSSWSCISANIDSFATNPQCASWTDDLICLQETRVAESNITEARCSSHANSKDFFPGKLLEHTRQKNGVYRIPHGGVAILGNSSKTTPFTPKDDSTGLWEGLFASTRVAAVWHQVLPKLKLLCFTFYAKSWKQHSEDEIHLHNDFLLSKIFEVASQFGDIPVLITGDMQAEPEAFESFQLAKLGGWIDPLASVDFDGNSNRATTFSRNSLFDPTESHSSSIDAILVNSIAASALDKVDICIGEGKQHAPIRAIFQWPKIFVKGHKLLQPAPLILDNLPSDKPNGVVPGPISMIAEDLLNNSYRHRCNVPDDQEAWDNINKLGVAILTKAGAQFAPGPGPHSRGASPRFVSRDICPGQDQQGSAWSQRTAQLTKIHNLVSELITRLQRPCSNTADMTNQWTLQQKVLLKLGKLRDFSNWSHQNCFNLVDLIDVQKKLHQLIIKAKRDLKTRRIAAWRQMIQQGTSSKNVAKEVFQWLKNKNSPKPSNQVVDSHGNILFQPQEALNEINSQWDDIFAANALSEDPQSVLQKIWPLVESSRNPIDLEPVQGCNLKLQILKRKSQAAPGIDGWRTRECQALPTVFFDIIADFFNQVENKKRCLPSILTTGKQIILDKNGSPEPLQKRLICLLPVFLLAYTGTRFGQLQGWMQQTLPRNLFGAIKGRHMSSIHTSLRLQIDAAKSEQQHLCGIKIDKSKCFDRIIPTTTAILFLAYGLPSGLTTFFLQMYGNLKRHLSYLNWISPVATTTTNGVVQGCSLSLIAINLNMAVWSNMINRIPHITACVFIDDAYLWVQVQHKHLLCKAIEMTEYWDRLCGQALNFSKCKTWGTSSQARKAIAELSPNMKLSQIIDVLGTQIQTAEAKSYGWTDQRTQKIARDIKNIMSLPCHRNITEHIIACKVIPQVTYAAHVNQIPKKALTFLQNKIAKALWKNKPVWRSKPLLLGVLSKPYRVDPTISRAYNIILDVLQFLKNTSASNRNLWISQCNAEYISPHSLCALFFQACAILDISLIDGVYISLWGSEHVALLDLTRRDFKKVLQQACRQAIYLHAAKSQRKDIHQPTGIIDFDVTNTGRKLVSNSHTSSVSLESLRDSVLVGCVITNDRASHLNEATSNLCRCCKNEVETMHHLVEECPDLPQEIPKPVIPLSCGPNFNLLGIVETSYLEAQNRLATSSTAHITVNPWQNEDLLTREHLWTDGSCDYGSMFFHTIAAYAVVDAAGRLRKSGPVKHWSLSAYAAELFAIIVAFADSTRPILIHCDCKSVVDQVHQMISDNLIPCVWSHLSWWLFLLQVWQVRKQLHPKPLEIMWIPAHVAEKVPQELVTKDLAQSFNTTVWDILNNRKADFFAKKAVDAIRTRPKQEVDNIHKQIANWQFFLASINRFLSETQVKPDQEAVCNQEEGGTPSCPLDKVLPHNVHGAHPVSVFQRLLPKWEWNPLPDEFQWFPSFEIEPKIHTLANISEEDWDNASRFFKGLRWKIGASLKISFLELAAQAFYSGFSFTAGDTPAIVSKILKKFLCLNSDEGVAPKFHPGMFINKCKSNGKTFPSGLISGAYAFVHPLALKNLAIPLLRGRDHRLSQWDHPFLTF